MKSQYIFLASVLILFLSSCNNKKDNHPETLEAEAKTYFDLKNYFLQQSKFLSANNVHLKKKITKDGKTEVKLFSKMDWQKELKPFSDADINKPSWSHSYFTDTLFSSKKMSVKYSARDASLPVQEIKLNFENNRLIQIYIHKQSSNNYYTAKNDYVFQPDSGFTITGLQEVMLADKTMYSITANFIR